jgi:hypothetical protein
LGIPLDSAKPNSALARRAGEAKRIGSSALNLKAVAREYVPRAIEKRSTSLERGETDRARISAGREILDRGYGKPTQHVAGDSNGEPVIVKHVVEWLNSVRDFRFAGSARQRTCSTKTTAPFAAKEPPKIGTNRQAKYLIFVFSKSLPSSSRPRFNKGHRAGRLRLAIPIALDMQTICDRPLCGGCDPPRIRMR